MSLLIGRVCSDDKSWPLLDESMFGPRHVYAKIRNIFVNQFSFQVKSVHFHYLKDKPFGFPFEVWATFVIK